MSAVFLLKIVATQALRSSKSMGVSRTGVTVIGWVVKREFTENCESRDPDPFKEY